MKKSNWILYFSKLRLWFTSLASWSWLRSTIGDKTWLTLWLNFSFWTALTLRPAEEFCQSRKRFSTNTSLFPWSARCLNILSATGSKWGPSCLSTTTKLSGRRASKIRFISNAWRAQTLTSGSHCTPASMCLSESPKYGGKSWRSTNPTLKISSMILKSKTKTTTFQATWGRGGRWRRPGGGSSTTLSLKST